MTAPDPRDSVERIVAEMRGLWMSGANYATARGVNDWANRLAAIPQQAGGEDVAAIQAEVARLRELLAYSRNVLNLLRSVVSAEGVRTFTHVESRSGSLVYVHSTIEAIDAAIGGTGDA